MPYDKKKKETKTKSPQVKLGGQAGKAQKAIQNRHKQIEELTNGTTRR